jgi:predicted amidohydrolase
MFDVELPGDETYRESDTYRPGAKTCVARTPWGGLGMTICYDVRFPELYRTLAKAGADLIAVPSAFTRQTGRAHWSVLLRARAIETGTFVFAPAQCGDHGGGRQTYGHSLIVDPWGEILAEAGEDVGVTYADIDVTKVADARRAIPSLSQDASYAPPSPARAAE